ncbi:RagB/SusD family nutrient uptake outer membrane protein [Parafilimonas terrae]|uniref:Starch-binding associating with outer membrane n=1 Tax=Parafilimonas terrae TaxID=1465490 RepID=A0A1I5YBA1_9BACT|nr:RagB/SusD family nutrient uptake outer membrane protein [Parafilimonas terrae]SFQ41468.1 Starch-binding associating with outer membrane [Parafilimonas terrae]
MKKYIAIFIVIAGCVAALSSCRKYESVPVETVTPDYIWDAKDSNGVYASQYLFSIYAALPQITSNRIGRDFLDAGSDDAVTSQTTAQSITLLATNGITIFNNPDDAWASSYKGIRMATNFLNNFGAVPLKNVNEKRSWFGEARVMRAFFYWELVRRYGGVPILGDSLKTLEDNIEIPRSSFATCVNYIVNECNRAADSLRDDPVDDANYGRFTKDAARALKARVLLYAASPLYNGGNIADSLNGYDSYDANRWKLAADAAKEIMNQGVYDLEENFIDIFISQRSKEVIYAKTNTTGKTVETTNGPINYATAPGSGNTSPTQELVDAYGMANGLEINDPNSGYNPEDPYTGRDPRLGYTVLYNGAQWLNTPIQTYIGGINRPGGATVQTQTGYYLRKFMGHFENTTTYEDHYHDLIYFRYADILLMYAEAMNEYAGPSDDVFAAVEKIRQRAGLNPYALDHGISKDSLRTVIRNERHKELAFEEQRYWDIRRWKIAGHVYNDAPLHAMNIINSPNGLVYNIQPVLTTAFDESKMYFYPIPYNEVVSNENMRQNPGWQ